MKTVHTYVCGVHVYVGTCVCVCTSVGAHTRVYLCVWRKIAWCSTSLVCCILGSREGSADTLVSCVHPLPVGCPSGGVRCSQVWSTLCSSSLFYSLLIASAYPEPRHHWPPLEASSEIAHLMRSL